MGWLQKVLASLGRMVEVDMKGNFSFAHVLHENVQPVINDPSLFIFISLYPSSVIHAESRDAAWLASRPQRGHGNHIIIASMTCAWDIFP